VREKHPGVRLIELERKVGKAENDSTLMKEARGRYCLLLNEDSELRQGAAGALYAALEDDPQAGAAGAQLFDGDGVLVVPQFVPRELQLVADSADSMKRNRGRRGLDVLQRIQKMNSLNVQILEEDFPQVREVDLKLIELAKLYDCKIVTNDFNLNKVAGLHGVQVLNINELANSLKPIVLPGETMRVFILKEGKEYNQGVAYLDDGTMVVVDNAKRMISKTIDIAVTSVLQTTAGKMIFGRYDERVHHTYEQAPAGQKTTLPEREKAHAPLGNPQA